MEAIDHQGEGVPRLGLSASGQRLPLFWKAEVRREYPGADRELGGGVHSLPTGCGAGRVSAPAHWDRGKVDPECLALSIY